MRTTFPSRTSNTMHSGSRTLRPVGGRERPGSRIGPVFVPSRTTSANPWAPSANAFVTVTLKSGSASRVVLTALTMASGPVTVSGPPDT